MSVMLCLNIRFTYYILIPKQNSCFQISPITSDWKYWILKTVADEHVVGAVLDRKFVMKQKTSMRNFDEKFSVVSYSIRLQQTAFTDEGMLSTELVNFSNRLTMEINCLAPEILCLQWVSLDYYPILQTTLSGLVN